LVDKIKTITAPTLIMTGDEDFGCLQPNIMMKKAIASAGLVVMPNCGHAINLEEPAMFNLHIEQFLHAVDVGAWRSRDPRAMAASILGKGTSSDDVGWAKAAHIFVCHMDTDPPCPRARCQIAWARRYRRRPTSRPFRPPLPTLRILLPERSEIASHRSQ